MNKDWKQVTCFRDPHEKFVNYEKEREHSLEVNLGYLPQFMNANDPRPLQEQMLEGYQACAGGRAMQFSEGSVTNSGVFKHPQDEDLYPMFMFVRGNEFVYVYTCGIVCMCVTDDEGKILSSFCGRMD